MIKNNYSSLDMFKLGDIFLTENNQRGKVLREVNADEIRTYDLDPTELYYVVEFENKIVPIQTYFINGEYVEYFRFLNSKEMFVEEN